MLAASASAVASAPAAAAASAAVVEIVMSQASTPPLRLLGYQALAQLAPAVSVQQLGPLVPQLLPALLQQLALSDEESLHLVLELLQVLIHSAAAPGSPGLAPEQALAVAQPVLQVGRGSASRHTAGTLLAGVVGS
jgi:hypothetical protein